MLPVVERAIAYFTSNWDANGLYSTPSDGLTFNWHPFDQAGGVDAHTNAVIYRALLGAAALEERLGSASLAADYLQEAATLKDAMLAHLWDPSVQAFLQNLSNPLNNHTQDAQVEAILSGIVTDVMADQALNFITQNLLKDLGVANGEFMNDPYIKNYISPFISGTELLARFSVGDAAGALSLLRRTWGFMLDAGPGTLWEKIAFDGTPSAYGKNIYPPNKPNGAGGVSHAHGWSGGSTAALSGYVLGIRPVTPGYETWIIAPQPGDLRWAQGQAPTPYGPLVSRWKRSGRPPADASA